MAIRNVQSDQEHLRRMWSAAKVIADDAVWTAMDGGRSNPIWRVDLADGPSLVCKLYDPSSATPLFANDGQGQERRWTFRGVIDCLTQITRNRVTVNGAEFYQNSTPTQEQEQILDLLQVRM